jgi:hypothetical protein
MVSKLVMVEVTLELGASLYFSWILPRTGT